MAGYARPHNYVFDNVIDNVAIRIRRRANGNNEAHTDDVESKMKYI